MTINNDNNDKEESKLKGKEAWALCMGMEGLCEAADAILYRYMLYYILSYIPL